LIPLMATRKASPSWKRHAGKPHVQFERRTEASVSARLLRPDAKRVLESLTAWIAEHLKLSVNQDKSGTGRPWERQFLSFQITEDGEIAIAPKASRVTKLTFVASGMQGKV
jgi:hypothetical protein